MENKAKKSQIGIIQVFRVKRSPFNKSDKNALPLLFEIRIQNGKQPMFMKYQDVKQNHPYLLIEFFQKKSAIETKLSQGQLINQEDTQPEANQAVKQQLDIVRSSQRLGRSRNELSAQKLQKEQKCSVTPMRLRTRKLNNSAIKAKFQQSESEGQILIDNEVKTQSKQITDKPIRSIMDYDYLEQQFGTSNIKWPAIIPTKDYKYKSNRKSSCQLVMKYQENEIDCNKKIKPLDKCIENEESQIDFNEESDQQPKRLTKQVQIQNNSSKIKIKNKPINKSFRF